MRVVLTPVAALQITNMYKMGLRNNKAAFHAGYVQALRDTLDSICGIRDPAMRHLSESIVRRLEALRDEDEHEEPERSTVEPSPRRPSSVRPRAAHTPRASIHSPSARTNGVRGDGNILVATGATTPSPGLRTLKGTGTGTGTGITTGIATGTGNGTGNGASLPSGDTARSGRNGRTEDTSSASEYESDDLRQPHRDHPRKRRRHHGEPDA